MHCNTKITITFLLLVAGSIYPLLFAQSIDTFELPLKSDGNFQFYVDVCQFENGPGKTRLEIYYAFRLMPADKRDTLNVQIHLLLSDAKEKLVDLWDKKSFPVTVTPGDSQLTFVDIKKFDLTPDTLFMYLSITDTATARKGVVKTSFEVRNFLQELSLSDLIFISSLYRPGKNPNSTFLRSGLIMLPNPSRIYRLKKTDAPLWFYFEPNHLQYHPDLSCTYSFQFYVIDLQGKQLFSQEKLSLPVTSSNIARVEKIPLQSFKPGIYKLKINLTENKTGTSVVAARYFQLIDNEAGEMQTLSMTDKDVQHYFDQIKYIASKEEKELFKQLDATGKSEFIIRFWQSKDPTPDTPENEFMTEHFRRLGHAEKAFNGGLDADMSRIFIQYGQPMEVQRMFSNRQYTKPVEIWTYGLHGKTEFIFVDRNGDGHYVLVHSNHQDEYANPDWERDVK